MTWIDVLLLIVAALGVFAAAYLIARSPAFWVGLFMVILPFARPYLVKLLQWLTKPLSPEDQKKLDASRRRAEEWDFARKKAKEDHK